MLSNQVVVEGVILAGGEARRMGGDDKGLVMLAGKPMIQHVIERISPQVSSLTINANRNALRYSDMGYPVVADQQVGEFPGPLAGMAAGLSVSQSDLVAFVPCDAPLLPLNLVERLKDALIEQNAEIAVAHDGEYWQPVFVLMQRSLLPGLENFLNGDGRKIMHWFQQQKLAKVVFSDDVEAFENVNTPEHCQRLERMMSRELAHD